MRERDRERKRKRKKEKERRKEAWSEKELGRYLLEGELYVDVRQVLVESLQASLILVLQGLVQLVVPVLLPRTHVPRTEPLLTHTHTHRHTHTTPTSIPGYGRQNFEIFARPHLLRPVSVVTWASSVAKPVRSSCRPSFQRCCCLSRSTFIRLTT